MSKNVFSENDVV